jgi:cell pole-organizing protein PopZ
MSRDSSGESLEAILASIRKGLAEQATSVLDGAAEPVEMVAPADASADLDAPPPPASLSQRLAVAPDELLRTAADRNGEAHASPVADALPFGGEPAPVVAPAPATASDPLTPDPDAAPSVGAAPAGPDQGREQKDPLWFLGKEPGQKAGAQAVGGADALKAILHNAGRVAPAPSRLGAVRGPLPPFFGSSAEAVKVEVAPEPPLLGGVDGPQGWPRPIDGGAIGKASSIFGPAEPEGSGGSGEASPQIQALEAMVAELLRPMLRRWLDEIMPRLVSAALKAEADLISKRGPKKP